MQSVKRFFLAPDRSCLPSVLLKGPFAAGLVVLAIFGGICVEQVWAAPAGVSLREQLVSEEVGALSQEALRRGDARRGAVVFYQSTIGCASCHIAAPGRQPLGPELTSWKERPKAEYLVESILHPSRVVRPDYQAVVILTDAGKPITGLFVQETKTAVTIRDPAQAGKTIAVSKETIDEWERSPQSLMPKNLTDQLGSRQQFLDLVKYLHEIAHGGQARADELDPPAAKWLTLPLPEYESDLDHAGLISDWNHESFKRGEAIYQRVCANCHGTHQRSGSLPTAPRFASGKLKNGSDPHSIYRTLTHGYGMMVPQRWMVPQQKYDVIHYIREAYLKSHNPSYYASLDDRYLEGLPQGTSRGPAPQNIQPWVNMNYGPSLINTYEIGQDGSNFAYKGIAVRLDPGPGGISRGRQWVVYDHDTLRLAAFWTGQGFIDWNGIHFNGRHGVHPRVVGQVKLANPTGPGWADPQTGSFEDTQRVVGRDKRRYGPLPRRWAHYKGLYHYGQQAILSYSVGQTDILETPGLVPLGSGSSSTGIKAQPDQLQTGSALTRTFNIGPRRNALTLQVAHLDQPASGPTNQVIPVQDEFVLVGPSAQGQQSKQSAKEATDSDQSGVDKQAIAFDGKAYAEVAQAEALDLSKGEWTVTARIRTKAGGTILCQTEPGAEWVRGGKVLFVSGGRLCFDIGWVGVVKSKTRVNDGRWHDVALTRSTQSGQVQLFIDNKLDVSGNLQRGESLSQPVIRLGFGAPDFPSPSPFVGKLYDIRFFNKRLSQSELQKLVAPAQPDQPAPAAKHLVAWWAPQKATGKALPDVTGNQHVASIVRGNLQPKGRRGSRGRRSVQSAGWMVAGLQPPVPQARWSVSPKGDLRLTFPAGREPLKVTLWMASSKDPLSAKRIGQSVSLPRPDADLTALTQGGPPRWPQTLETQATLGEEEGPLAVDELTDPENNPWLCQMRLTGLDFYPDGRRMAVCSWDGDVWLVSGIEKLQPNQPSSSSNRLSWKRIASGLFQPLGVKIVDNAIYVTCRDQLVILRDLNGDGETDFYESFNSDHQVTEHFHEFAMGLQVDDEGRFYYAKSARHALTALVPHHGTLLRISADGSRTDILATGFRAANGVCLNPDGTFYVTDQEGHWTPKNRINWVRPGKFYGNIYGYTDVTDTSDQAMEPPICWITNSYDRSPGELLRVNSESWGPLNGALLNLSYGYGKIYVVLKQQVGDLMQGGVCELPLPPFPTGIMRGRFHSKDGHLYSCGMFAWAGNRQHPGGLYRVRATGQPFGVPVSLKAHPQRLRLTFSEKLNARVANDPRRYNLKVWSLRRSSRYGSRHYDERPLTVSNVELSQDGRTLELNVEDLKPTWCMEIRYDLQSAAGDPIRGRIHNTIHQLPELKVE